MRPATPHPVRAPWRRRHALISLRLTWLALAIALAATGIASAETKAGEAAAASEATSASEAAKPGAPQPAAQPTKSDGAAKPATQVPASDAAKADGSAKPATQVPTSDAAKAEGGAKPAAAPPVAIEPVPAMPTLRVGTTGDYAPFSRLEVSVNEGGEEARRFTGFDIDVAEAFAAAHDLRVEIVPFRWGDLDADLAAGHFDVAMSGVTIRPERSVRGRFTVPVLETGAVALVAADSALVELDDIDDVSVEVVVNAGGHLERVTRARFPHATIVAIPDNAAVQTALLDRSFDVVVTDNIEAGLWRVGHDDLRVLGPFTHDRKAYLVAADRAGLAADLDRWLIARETDSTLSKLRIKWFGIEGSLPTATVMKSLFAAIGERLALMPLVARVKHAQGLALEDVAREQEVIEAAVAAAGRAAEAASRPPPSAAAVRRLFEAQIAAGKELQSAELAALATATAVTPTDGLPSLEHDLRPAIGRVGDKIARLVVAFDKPIDSASARKAAAHHLAETGLRAETRDAIADAVAAIGASPR